MLSTRVCGIALKHPIMNASGILGSEPEHIDILADYGVSAIVTKTITVEPRTGFEPPVVVELRNGGVLNAVGLANPGIDAIPRLVERAKIRGLPIIVSIGGRSVEEFVKLGIVADEVGADAVELNLSCPHTRGYGIEIGADPNNVYEVVKAVASTIKIPVIAKLGFCDRVVLSAEKALEAGARALTLINTIKAMAIDVYSCKPILSNVFGGLSGPPIHPIAVRIVYEVYRELRAEIIGCGGICSWEDAAEMLLAGARALQIGTCLALYGGKIINDILKGLQKWLEVLGFNSIEDVIGAAHS